MIGRSEGLLVAARKAREKAEEYRAQGNRAENQHCYGSVEGRKYFKWAELFDEFASWCEFEADTYQGASMTTGIR